jgi:hypothetical protein
MWPSLLQVILKWLSALFEMSKAFLCCRLFLLSCCKFVRICCPIHKTLSAHSPNCNMLVWWVLKIIFAILTRFCCLSCSLYNECTCQKKSLPITKIHTSAFSFGSCWRSSSTFWLLPCVSHVEFSVCIRNDLTQRSCPSVSNFNS